MKAIHILNAAKFISLLLTGAAGLLAGAAPVAAAPSADEIVAKAYKVDGGQDGVSRLTFTFSKPGAADKKLAYTMVWKSYGGKDNLDIKLIFFADFPPDDRGKAFLTYVYKDRMDDQWIYLPELRMVRKMSHDPDQHRPDDDFAHSVLGRFDLVPRDPSADQHQLVREDTYEGHPYYVIESAPKSASEQYPYSKIVRWIAQDSFITGRIDYYRDGSAPFKSQYLHWRQIGNNWVWERVTGEDKNGSRTVLDLSDVRINLNLKDDVFSARSLRNGIESVLR